MMIVVFEDEQVAQLDPAALGRPAFAISCGSFRLIDLLADLKDRTGIGSLRVVVRPHLRAIVAADFPQLLHGDVPLAGPTLLVNARLVPSVAAVDQLQAIVAAGHTGLIRSGDSIAAALVDCGAEPSPARVAGLPIVKMLAQLGLEQLRVDLPLFAYPHDILRHHLSILPANLARRLARGDYQQVAEGVFLSDGASLGQYVVTDTAEGPIVLERGATVGPFSYLSGPLHIGAGARVLEHASLKHGVALGHTTKSGGEIEASIIEPFSNKQHHGFLGHSYLGSWINLGAGTCNSDLKNTYGPVNMEYRGRKMATGMQFVGAIVGDYAKTAINTGIFTGKTIGVCSMVYGFVTTNVPSFVNYARLFDQVSEAPVEIMAAAQRRMFERRGVDQRACDIQLLHDMYLLTAHERQIPGEPLSIEPLSL